VPQRFRSADSPLSDSPTRCASPRRTAHCGSARSSSAAASTLKTVPHWRFPPSSSYFTNPHGRTFMPTDSLMGYALLAGAVFTPFLITVGLVEAVYFINVAFMALFVFATPGK
jgi:hypothetical protein